MASGFANIGYVANLKTYVEDIKALNGAFVDFATLNAHLDAQWSERMQRLYCLSDNLERRTPDADDIQYILLDTGYQTQGGGEPIFGAFFSEIGPTDLSDVKRKWKGVEIGTEAQLLERWRQSASVIGAQSGLMDIQVPNWGKLGEVLDRMVPAKAGADWQDYILQTYKEACAAGQFAQIYPEKAAPIAYFRLNLTDESGEPLWAYSEEYKRGPNGGNNGNKRWFGLYITPQSEFIIVLCRRHHYCLGDANIIFDSSAQSDEFLKNLAQKAMRENWEWSKRSQEQEGTANRYPILRNYIEHTYLKLCAEAENGDANKLIEYQGKVYFNSGLLDRRFNQIIFVGERTSMELPLVGVIPMLRGLTAYAHTEREIARNFKENELPGIAKYFQKREQVVFDASLDIHLNELHVYRDGVSRGRLPKYKEEYERLKDNPEELELLIARIDRDFKSARDRARLMAERNYKLAVPQYWRETGKIQFLLPIYLGEREEAEVPQCALALDCDDTGRIPYYRGATILTLEMAYNNARLLAKPDVFWLNSTIEE